MVGHVVPEHIQHLFREIREQRLQYVPNQVLYLLITAGNGDKPCHRVHPCALGEHLLGDLAEG